MPSSTARRRIMLWRKGVRRCARCGQPLGDPDQATLEHIVPKSAGGRTTRANLWYENLLATAPSSRVPSPREIRFQIISAIESAVTIAEGSGIRERGDLEKNYGKGSWLKRKGQAIVRLDDGTIRRAELHWYEAHGIGRRDLKIKPYLDL